MKSFYQGSLIIAVILVLVISGCQPNSKDSKLMGETVTKNNVTDIFKKLRDDKTFTSKDFELFSRGMTRLVSMSVDSLTGKSVGQIIQSEDIFEREQIAASGANQATKIQLVMNHEFKYLGMDTTSYVDKDKNKKQIDVLVYDVKNTSNKEIESIQGVLQFMDKDNQIVKVYPIVTSKIMKGEVFKAGEIKRIKHPFDHDVNNERDERVRKEHPNLRPIWICTEIDFKDGTKISVTNTL